MTAKSPQILAIHHLVHEYVNFVSSAELTINGRDYNLNKCGIKSPLNHHVSHAFYLNCRKLADFFQNNCQGRDKDDMFALHFVTGFQARLPVCDEWRGPMNKQLAHLTYARDIKAREISRPIQEALYKELKEAWQEFRRCLPKEYSDEVATQLDEKKMAPEFLDLPLE